MNSDRARSTVCHPWENDKTSTREQKNERVKEWKIKKKPLGKMKVKNETDSNLKPQKGTAVGS